MIEVDIKSICYDCRNCQPVGLIMVGNPNEGGGEENAYKCLQKQDMSAYNIQQGCWQRDQCVCFDE